MTPDDLKAWIARGQAAQAAVNEELRMTLAKDAKSVEPPQYPHWQCRTHGPFDAYVAVGCPECVREQRSALSESGTRVVELVTKLDAAEARITELRTALEAVAVPDADCGMCDRGRLLEGHWEHWPECPFALAAAVLAKADAGEGR